MVKIEGRVLLEIETPGYGTENDATFLAKFDLNDPKNPLTAGCTMCYEYMLKNMGAILTKKQDLD